MIDFIIRRLRLLGMRDWFAIALAIAVACAMLLLSIVIRVTLIQILLQNVASLIGITGVMSVIFRKITILDIIEKTNEKNRVNQQITTSGLFFLSNNFNEIKYEDEIRLSKEEIDVIQIYGSTWIKKYREYLKDSIEQNNVKVNFIFLDPSAPIVKILERKFEYANEQGLSEKIKDAIELIKTLKKDIKHSANIKIYITSMIPQYAAYRIDKKLFIIPYFNSPGRAKVPIFGFSNECQSAIFEEFMKDITKIKDNYCKEII